MNWLNALQLRESVSHHIIPLWCLPPVVAAPKLKEIFVALN